MGIDTRCKLRGRVTPEQIVRFLETKYTDVVNETSTRYTDIPKDCVCIDLDDVGRWAITGGFITFTDINGDRRMLHYFYDNLKFFDDLATCIKNEEPDEIILMYASKTTSLSLGCWGNSVEILKGICEEFGGWLDENDCDENDFYRIDKKEEN